MNDFNNSKVIHSVAFTVCFAVIFGLLVEGACMVFHIPIPSDQIAGAFIHTLDTFVGAVIGMLIKTTPQSSVPPPVEISNTKDNPVPVEEGR